MNSDWQRFCSRGQKSWRRSREGNGAEAAVAASLPSFDPARTKPPVTQASPQGEALKSTYWWGIWTACSPREAGIWTRQPQKFKSAGVAEFIKGDIPEHFNIFKTTMKYSHGYSTRNSYLPKLPKIRTDWGKRITSYKCTIDWSSLPDVLKRPMPCDIFKQKIKNFLTAKYF